MFAKKSFLMVGQNVAGETYPSNYQKVGGIMFAHAMDMSVNGMSMQVVYDKIEVNVPMEDGIFAMPKK